MSTRSLTVSKSPGIKPSIAPGLRRSRSKLKLQQLLELRRVDGLGYVLIEAGLAGEAAVAVFAVSAERYEECIPETELATDPLRDLVPVHLRHADIEQDDLGAVQPSVVERLSAVVGSGDLVAVVAQ